MYPSVLTENNFYTDGSMIDDLAGFSMHNRNYETGHQLAKQSSVFSAEISAIRMALEHIQICPRGRYLILSTKFVRVFLEYIIIFLAPSQTFSNRIFS
jgi:hypothetical protein